MPDGDVLPEILEKQLSVFLAVKLLPHVLIEVAWKHLIQPSSRSSFSTFFLLSSKRQLRSRRSRSSFGKGPELYCRAAQWQSTSSSDLFEGDVATMYPQQNCAA